MTRYFAHISAAGPVRYGEILSSIGILEALDQPMPMGMASEIGWTEGGLAVWRLHVHRADVPG
jgi:hypothetical protein